MRPFRTLIIVNPKAGQQDRSRVETWTAQLTEFWSSSGDGDGANGGPGQTPALVETTQGQAHAERLAHDWILSTRQGGSGSHPVDTTFPLLILCLGGDGTIHEVVNGVHQAQREASGPVWLGVVPLGSGNALAASLGFTDVDQAIHRYTNPTIQTHPCLQPFHLIETKVPADAVSLDGTRVPPPPPDTLRQSFCVLSWGFHCSNVADSEWLRWLGPSRFSIIGFKNLLTLRDYHGTVRLEGARRFYPSPTATTTPPLSSSSTAEPNPPTLPSPFEGEFRSLENNDATPLAQATDRLNRGQDTLELDGPFTIFLAAKQATLSAGFCIAPLATPADPYLDVVMGRGLTRAQLWAFLQGATVGGGTHVQLPYVEYYKVRGLTMQPSSQRPLQASHSPNPNARHTVCIDGEIMSFHEPGVVEARVTPATLGLQTLS
ncbi:ATP-NAD kinase-like domain-containing protein [Dimargaris cristalligena]|uniref:ATP-NAD kinase-like domain-containing protein n=1 Tax=Dimargaris cristalligena TaxID=215637 RepID=A0A4Q0A401_9FUNG|nr:ATP-NAD kinase-like domain-containing protein [Dimargaris cristalligena]|eukprot:RKP40132.1 ATP-NAD kinase-like domain-containing protein [Dimargaris cristalligena]